MSSTDPLDELDSFQGLGAADAVRGRPAHPVALYDFKRFQSDPLNNDTPNRMNMTGNAASGNKATHGQLVDTLLSPRHSADGGSSSTSSPFGSPGNLPPRSKSSASGQDDRPIPSEANLRRLINHGSTRLKQAHEGGSGGSGAGGGDTLSKSDSAFDKRFNVFEISAGSSGFGDNLDIDKEEPLEASRTSSSSKDNSAGVASVTKKRSWKKKQSDSAIMSGSKASAAINSFKRVFSGKVGKEEGVQESTASFALNRELHTSSGAVADTGSSDSIPTGTNTLLSLTLLSPAGKSVQREPSQNSASKPTKRAGSKKISEEEYMLREEYENAMKRIQMQDKDIRKLLDTKKTQKETETALRFEIRKLEQRITELEAHAPHDESSEVLKKIIADLKVSRDELTEEHKKLNAQVEEAQTELKAAKKEEEAVSRQLKKVQYDLAMINEEYSLGMERLDEANAALSRTEQDLERSNQALVGLNSKLSEAQASLALAQEEIEHTKLEVISTRQAMEAEHSELGSLKELLQIERSEKSELSELCQSLRQEVESLQGERTSLAAQLKANSEELEALKKQAADNTSSLEFFREQQQQQQQQQRQGNEYQKVSSGRHANDEEIGSMKRDATTGSVSSESRNESQERNTDISKEPSRTGRSENTDAFSPGKSAGNLKGILSETRSLLKGGPTSEVRSASSGSRSSSYHVRRSIFGMKPLSPPSKEEKKVQVEESEEHRPEKGRFTAFEDEGSDGASEPDELPIFAMQLTEQLHKIHKEISILPESEKQRILSRGSSLNSKEKEGLMNKSLSRIGSDLGGKSTEQPGIPAEVGSNEQQAVEEDESVRKSKAIVWLSLIISILSILSSLAIVLIVIIVAGRSVLT